MSFFTKARVPVAQEHHSRFDLSCNHVTTMEFNQLRPVYFNEFMPASKIDVSCSSITRLMPLLRPFYGSVKLRNFVTCSAYFYSIS